MSTHTSAINLEGLLGLLKSEAHLPGPKITIYFSMPKNSDFAIIGRAYLKSLIHSAMDKLHAWNLSEEQLKGYRKSLDGLLEDASLWQHRSEAIVIFASATLLRYYALPLELTQSAHVGTEYFIRPLVGLFSLPDQFYILDVSLGKPRMLRVHPELSVEIELPGVVSLKEYEEEETLIKNRSFHTASLSYGVKTNGRLHGSTAPHDSLENARSVAVDQFLRNLARTVDAILRIERSPLILTGTGDMIGHFRKYLYYKRVIIASKKLDLPTSREEKRLFWSLCLPIVLPSTLWARHFSSFQEFKELLGTGYASDVPDEILQQAQHGKVQTLFLHGDGEVTRPLANIALIETLKHKGTVVEVNEQQFPISGMAAIFRPTY